MRRDEAAEYFSVSPTKFDEMVRDGRAPQPFHIDGRKVWDLYDLDEAFEALKRPARVMELDSL